MTKKRKKLTPMQRLKQEIKIQKTMVKWKIPLYKSFVDKKKKIHIIRADSHNGKTLLKIKKILKGQKLDFILIDVDHKYKGVKKDFEMYSSLMTK